MHLCQECVLWLGLRDHTQDFGLGLDSSATTQFISLLKANILKNIYLYTLSLHSCFLSHPKITLAKVISGFSMLTKFTDHFITLQFTDFSEAFDTVKHSLLQVLSSRIFIQFSYIFSKNDSSYLLCRYILLSSAIKVRAPHRSVLGPYPVLYYLPNLSCPHAQHL